MLAAALRGRVFYGWYIVAGGIVINMLMGGLVMHSFNFYVAELKNEFLWSATLFGIAFMITRIESGVLGPIQGWLIDRFGPQTMMRIGILSTTIGMLAFSQLWSQGTFIAFYFIVAIGASVGGFMTVSVSVVTWFERKRSRALGFMSTGFALGGFMTPVVSALIENLGWRSTAIVSAIILFVVGQILATLFVRQPQDKGLMKDGEPVPENGSPGRPLLPTNPHRHRDFSVREAMRTKAFWGLALAHGAPLLVVSGIFVHFASLVIEIDGLTVVHASAAYTAMNVAQFGGQLGMGYLGDKFSKRLLLIPAMIGHAGAAVMLAFASSFEMVMLAAIINGLAWGSRAPLITALRADYFGASNFGKIMGWSSVVMSTFMTVGGFLSGVLFDATGSYTVPFLVLGIGALTGVIWVAMSGRPRLPGVRVVTASGALRRAQPIAMFRANQPAQLVAARTAPQRTRREP